MFNHTLRLTAVVAVVLSTAPAFALCNPGTKNCIPIGAGLTQAKNQVFNQGLSGQCDPGPAGICDDNLPGSDVVHKAPKTGLGFTPIAPSTPVEVK